MAYVYSARDWKPVALILGGWRLPDKLALERLATVYRAATDKADVAAKLRAEHDRLSEIRDATVTYLAVLEASRADFHLPDGASLSTRLQRITEALDAELDEIRWRMPANAADPARAWYVRSLVTYWYGQLRRTDRPAVDRITGRVHERGVIAFLMAASRPVLPRNHPLTPEAARDAVRSYDRKAAPVKVSPKPAPTAPENTADFDDAIAAGWNGELRPLA